MASLLAAAVSLGAAGISAFFGYAVLDRWREGRRPHHLAWGLGLVAYALAALLQGAGEAVAWSVPLYKTYYVAAAALVFLLGLGSIFLLSRRAGRWGTAYFVVLLALMAGVMAPAQVNEDVLATAAIPGGEPLRAGDDLARTARSLGLLFTIPGSVALIGIALYGLVRYRLRYNLAIAGGALIVAAGGLAARLDEPAFLYVTQFVGIAVMYLGFVRSRMPAAGPLPPQARAG